MTCRRRDDSPAQVLRNLPQKVLAMNKADGSEFIQQSPRKKAKGAEKVEKEKIEKVEAKPQEATAPVEYSS